VHSGIARVTSWLAAERHRRAALPSGGSRAGAAWAPVSSSGRSHAAACHVRPVAGRSMSCPLPLA